MKKIYLILIVYLCVGYSFGQTITTTIDYTTGTACLTGQTQCFCSYFNSTADPREIGNIKHYAASGGCQFDGSVITMPTHYDMELNSQTASMNNIDEGTAYVIKYSFKKNYTYTISIDAGYTPEISRLYPTVALTAWSDLPDPNITNNQGCGAVSEYMRSKNGYTQPSGPIIDAVDIFVPGTIVNGVPKGTITTYNATSFKPTYQFNYLAIVAYNTNSPSTVSAKIKKIVIKETPSVTFNISPNSLNLLGCSPTPQTFTVNTVGIPTGALSYVWDLGSANNGWEISPNTNAPQTINTSIPTITLTPRANAAVLSSVAVTVVMAGANQPKLTCAVNYTAPTFTLSPQTLDIQCSNSLTQTFTVTNVNNLPCNLTYECDLGSSTNGWMYNGSTASQIIDMGASNSITLNHLPCGINPTNVKINVKIDGVVFTSLNCNVSTLPTLQPDIQGPSIICDNTPKTFTVTNLTCGASVTWPLSVPGLLTIVPNGNSCTVTKTGDGAVDLTATINGIGCTNSGTTIKHIQLGVYEKPTVLGMQHSITPHIWLFEASLYSNQVTYYWYNNGITATSDVTDPNLLELTIPCNNIYSVTCQVRNACGYSVISDPVNTNYIPCPVDDLPINPNPLFDQPIYDIPRAGISFIDNKSSFQVYPNPAKTKFYIKSLMNKGQIIVTNLLGMQLYQQPLHIGTNTIDIVKFSKGIYLVNIITGEGKITQKLLVE